MRNSGIRIGCRLRNQQVWRSQSNSPRLEALRQQLEAEAKTEVIKVRGSKKNLPKPAWLKAEVPSGENYENLRKTGEILSELLI
jgi:hypothetical protein